MALPNSYTLKPSAITAYFDAILGAEAPDRFSNRFLLNLEFKSTNDRLFINILKELGFIDADGIPTQRYYKFLDKSQSAIVLAEAIRETYSDLFSVNKNAQTLSATEVKNKLRTLYAGSKKDAIIGRIARTFTSLCEYADFTPLKKEPAGGGVREGKKNKEKKESEQKTDFKEQTKGVTLDSLQYNINIVLPESRDQAVYDALFKALKEHIG